MLRQIFAVTGVNIRSIRQRLGSSSVAVVDPEIPTRS